MERRRFLLGAAPAVLGAGIGAVGARGGASVAGAAAPVATNARRGAGLGTQRVVWSAEAPDAAVTFDDGPDPDLTPIVLDLLAARRITATFMLIGAFAADHPALVDRIRTDGHEIGNHTWTHPGLDALPPDEVRAELRRTADLLGPMRFFRPPRGLLSGVALQAAAEHGYDVLLWSTEAGDGIASGDVCVMHDGLGRAGFEPGSSAASAMRDKRRRELAALPAVLDRALAAGVRFVPASALVTNGTATAVAPA